MKVVLEHYTPLHIASMAIRRCWDSEDKSDTVPYKVDYVNDDVADFHLDGRILECGPNDKALIDRVGNKFKHSSTLEHLNYSFTIKGISRACLQELARHRHQSLSVESTRYTLSKHLKNEEPFLYYNGSKLTDEVINDDAYNRAANYLVFTGDDEVDTFSIRALENVRKCVEANTANDKLKYCLPEAFKVTLASSWNARSLQNFISLRTSKAALWEIRNLANTIYNQLPEDHKFLFKEFIHNDSNQI